jgi:hypothetical protein
MKTAFTWTDETPVDREALAAILKCDDHTLDLAQRAIVRARGYLAPDSNTDVKELRKSTDVLRGSLSKMRLALKHMDGADHFLDDEFAIENDGDTTLMALRQRTGASSGFAAMVEHMARAVAAFEQESLQPAQKGQHTDGKHTLAILELAQFVRQHVPGLPVTHTARSRFPRLVALALPGITESSTTTIRRALAVIQ